VRKMKVGPSESPCRRRLQTAISCCGPKAAVVNVMVKRRGARSRHVWIREMSENDPLMKHRKPASANTQMLYVMETDAQSGDRSQLFHPLYAMDHFLTAT
jgi:hypothetical protein